MVPGQENFFPYTRLLYEGYRALTSKKQRMLNRGVKLDLVSADPDKYAVDESVSRQKLPRERSEIGLTVSAVHGCVRSLGGPSPARRPTSLRLRTPCSLVRSLFASQASCLCFSLVSKVTLTKSVTLFKCLTSLQRRFSEKSCCYRQGRRPHNLPDSDPPRRRHRRLLRTLQPSPVLVCGHEQANPELSLRPACRLSRQRPRCCFLPAQPSRSAKHSSGALMRMGSHVGAWRAGYRRAAEERGRSDHCHPDRR